MWQRRVLASGLSGLLLSLGLIAAPARAEGVLGARLDPGRLSALHGLPSPALAAELPESAPSVAAETARADAWILGMHDARARRERAERWGFPLLFGIAGVVSAGSMVLTKNTASQVSFAGATALAAAGFGLSFAVEPPQRGPLFVLGGTAFAAAFSAGAIIDAYKHSGCDGYCFNERSFGWLGGALAAEALTFLPLAFVDRGPSRLELAAYARLPVADRPHAARMLLSRIDRAERKALAVSLVMQLAALAVLTTGAAVVRDDKQQIPLFALSGVGFGVTGLMTLVSLLKKSRLERFVSGERPAEVERVFW